jgi:DNA-binding MarR family transcriptional regulator
MDEEFPGRPVIGLLLRLAYQHYSHDIEAALGEAGFGDVRPAAANVFPFVPPEGIAVSRLAELARVRKQSMAQAVEQLERTGYVERRPDPHDHRSRLVFLTGRGASVPLITHAAAEQVEQLWEQLIGADEFETLRGLLMHLLTELRGLNET